MQYYTRRNSVRGPRTEILSIEGMKRTSVAGPEFQFPSIKVVHTVIAICRSLWGVGSKIILGKYKCAKSMGRLNLKDSWILKYLNALQRLFLIAVTKC